MRPYTILQGRLKPPGVILLVLIHGHHQHLHHQRARTNNTTANGRVEKALEALRIANRLRIENYQANTYEFNTTRAAKSQKSSVPLLDYTDASKNKTLTNVHKREDGSNSNRLYGYTVSKDIARAAKDVAESQPPTPWEADYASIASRVRAKYSSGNNDTNVMNQQKLKKDGLIEYTIFEQPRGLQDETQDTLSKLWRNVKDYGAKGDGETDDTEAINLAISDGDRCGADCASSTRYPATVWFPGGTYLVSSSIIQYYNTEFIGDPTDVPTILAASSFVGLGVITSDVYVGESEQWYLNTNNFLRSVRNFKLDITRTDPSAYVCAIHWQVAQGTSLENIEFYMLQNVEGNTQQGIYMENGSGGFLADLTFVGGNFGAYFGNQQFTTSHLVFVNCNTALQIHWDWAWTMQDVVVESCKTGIVITGGAGGPVGSTGQGVGSFLLVDAIIANTPKGIVTSLHAENSTSMLLQNVGFFNVKTSITDSVLSRVLLEGGDEVFANNWGFGRVTNSDGTSQFVNAANLPEMNRTQSLLSSELAYVKPNFYTRRRPKYLDIGTSQVINLKSAGAKGDGVTDDTSALNSVFSAAGNMSSIVYIPYGVYVITDTVKIPVGSRIIGQAWPQILAKGPKFENQLEPRVAVKVGEQGESGIVEIQDLLLTVSGPTAGAVLLQWNIHETTQGSAGLWDSHFRVGGAIGSDLQKEQCPKGGGKKENCLAASALLHMTPKSSAYMENVWMWVADHDLDTEDEGQIDIFSGRGALIESQGPTWMYSTSSEHNILYQYQLANANNTVMGMIQTESPYFQPSPQAPQPITTGSFPNDPTFGDCSTDSRTCGMSWGMRMLDSSSVYLLGAGLYSWYSDYSQDCVDSGNCQDRVFEVEQSYDVWIFNLVTKGIVEMISPVNENPTLAADNKNGFMSSTLAWLKGSKGTTGERDFPGFTVFTPDGLPSSFSEECVNALSATIKCEETVFSFWEPSYHGSLGDIELTDAVCDSSCGDSLSTWFHNAQTYCSGYSLANYPAEMYGGNMWAGWNETCYRDPDTGFYCNEVIRNFTKVATVNDMPSSEMCSYCYVTKLQMMQSSPYSYYDDFYKSNFETVLSKCGISGDTTLPPSLIIGDPEEEEEELFCLSDITYTTQEGDTCTSIALDFSVSSAALYMGNQDLIRDCERVVPNKKICIPLSCQYTYVLQPDDTCRSIEKANSQRMYDADTRQGFYLRDVNPWIDTYCDNLHETSTVYGRVLCLSPQGGLYNTTDPAGSGQNPVEDLSGWGSYLVEPPENATVAEGTTRRCGRWHTAAEEESCAAICTQESITSNLFLTVNPSLDRADCSGSVVSGLTYCTGPLRGWNYTRKTKMSVVMTGWYDLAIMRTSILEPTLTSTVNGPWFSADGMATEYMVQVFNAWQMNS
ncbi:pectin lyase-like protein [Aspergillus stella-maris]|uniref:pectin lyase-like protein n=1 Tax=Aspergillus stella-maris TaxID=1810926 RepID=UPI003CCE23C5